DEQSRHARGVAIVDRALELGPRRPEPLRDFALARLGDVAFLKPELALERRALLLQLVAARAARHRVGGVAHPLRREHALLIVFEDVLRAAIELADRPPRHIADENERQRERDLRQHQLGPQRHGFVSSSGNETICTSKPAASRTNRNGTDRPNTCRHHGWCERPMRMCPTPCARAKSSRQSTGSLPLSRTTSAPSSRA